MRHALLLFALSLTFVLIFSQYVFAASDAANYMRQYGLDDNARYCYDFGSVVNVAKSFKNMGKSPQEAVAMIEETNKQRKIKRSIIVDGVNFAYFKLGPVGNFTNVSEAVTNACFNEMRMQGMTPAK